MYVNPTFTSFTAYNTIIIECIPLVFEVSFLLLDYYSWYAKTSFNIISRRTGRSTLNQGGGFLSSVPLQHLPSISHCIPSQTGSSPYRLLLTHVVVEFPDSQKYPVVTTNKSRYSYSIAVHIAGALPAIGCSGGTISKSYSKCPNMSTRHSIRP